MKPIFAVLFILAAANLYAAVPEGLITKFTRTDITWRSHPNRIYALQTTTNLLGSQQWYTTGIATGASGNNTSMSITMNDSVKFYRVMFFKKNSECGD